MDAHAFRAAFRAASQFDSGDHDEAIRSADKALKIDEKAPFFYYLRGAGYFHKNSLDQSIKDLSQAIRLDGKNAQYYNVRGLAYEKNGEMAKANADFGRRDALLGKTAEGSDAKRLAKQRMDEAEAAFLQAQALYNADDARYVQERNTALAQNGRRRAMGLPPVVVRPADPQLAQRAQAARQVYLEARRAYEQTP
jgi:tetratricopeptide (TPR) repeat protein